MLKHAPKKVFTIGLTSICVLTILISVLIVAAPSRAQEQSSSFASLLKNLTDKNVTIYIKFISPTSGDSIGWFIPDKLKVDGQEAGQRVLREIGDDYICVDEIGQGLTNVYCVPFTNISYVNYYP